MVKQYMNEFSRSYKIDKLTLPLTACGENMLLIFTTISLCRAVIPGSLGCFLPPGFVYTLVVKSSQQALDNCVNNQAMFALCVVWWLLFSCKLTELGVFSKCKQLLFAFHFHSRRYQSEISCKRLLVFDLSTLADTGRLRSFLLIRQSAI